MSLPLTNNEVQADESSLADLFDTSNDSSIASMDLDQMVLEDALYTGCDADGQVCFNPSDIPTHRYFHGFEPYFKILTFRGDLHAHMAEESEKAGGLPSSIDHVNPAGVMWAASRTRGVPDQQETPFSFVLERMVPGVPEAGSKLQLTSIRLFATFREDDGASVDIDGIYYGDHLGSWHKVSENQYVVNVSKKKWARYEYEISFAPSLTSEFRYLKIALSGSVGDNVYSTVAGLDFRPELLVTEDRVGIPRIGLEDAPKYLEDRRYLNLPVRQDHRLELDKWYWIKDFGYSEQSVVFKMTASLSGGYELHAKGDLDADVYVLQLSPEIPSVFKNTRLAVKTVASGRPVPDLRVVRAPGVNEDVWQASSLKGDVRIDLKGDEEDGGMVTYRRLRSFSDRGVNCNYDSTPDAERNQFEWSGCDPQASETFSFSADSFEVDEIGLSKEHLVLEIRFQDEGERKTCTPDPESSNPDSIFNKCNYANFNVFSKNEFHHAQYCGDNCWMARDFQKYMFYELPSPVREDGEWKTWRYLMPKDAVFQMARATNEGDGLSFKFALFGENGQLSALTGNEELEVDYVRLFAVTDEALKHFERVRDDQLGILPAERVEAGDLEEEISGFAIFQRPVTQRIFPGTRPDANEVGTDFRPIKVTPGEVQALTFGIYPFEAIENLSVKWESLPASSAGATLPAENIQIQQVRYNKRRWGINWRSVNHASGMQPDGLVDFDTLDLKAGEAQQVWLTFRIPEGTAPGTYSGTLLVGGQSISLRVYVYPFELKPSPVLHIMSGATENLRTSIYVGSKKDVFQNIKDNLLGLREVSIASHSGAGRRSFEVVAGTLTPPAPPEVRPTLDDASDWIEELRSEGVVRGGGQIALSLQGLDTFIVGFLRDDANDPANLLADLPPLTSRPSSDGEWRNTFYALTHPHFIRSYMKMIMALEGLAQEKGVRFSYMPLDEAAHDYKKQILGKFLGFYVQKAIEKFYAELGTEVNPSLRGYTYMSYRPSSGDNPGFPSALVAQLFSEIDSFTDPFRQDLFQDFNKDYSITREYDHHNVTPFEFTPEKMVDGKNQGISYGFYDTGVMSMSVPILNRFLSGLFAARTGTDTVWHYEYGSDGWTGNTDFGFGGKVMRYSSMLPTWKNWTQAAGTLDPEVTHRFVRTISLESLREGIKDGYYLATLASSMWKAKQTQPNNGLAQAVVKAADTYFAAYLGDGWADGAVGADGKWHFAKSNVPASYSGWGKARVDQNFFADYYGISNSDLFQEGETHILDTMSGAIDGSSEDDVNPWVFDDLRDQMGAFIERIDRAVNTSILTGNVRISDVYDSGLTAELNAALPGTRSVIFELRSDETAYHTVTLAKYNAFSLPDLPNGTYGLVVQYQDHLLRLFESGERTITLSGGVAPIGGITLHLYGDVDLDGDVDGNDFGVLSQERNFDYDQFVRNFTGAGVELQPLLMKGKIRLLPYSENLMETLSRNLYVRNNLKTNPSLAVTFEFRDVNVAGLKYEKQVLIASDGAYRLRIEDMPNGTYDITVTSRIGDIHFLPSRPARKTLTRGGESRFSRRLFRMSDYDRDGDVDGEDFGVFASCYNGPGRPPDGCSAEQAQLSDYDSDGDVDREDYGRYDAATNQFVGFRINYTGAV